MFEAVCIEARQVSPAPSALRDKTDRNDALGSAQILWKGCSRPAHIKSLETHGAQTLLSHPKADSSGVDLANVKMSMPPLGEIAVEQVVRLKEAGKADDMIAVSIGETRKAAGGAQTIKVKMPRIISIDLRLNEPR